MYQLKESRKVLGAYLKARREELEMTRLELSERTRIHIKSIYRIERGASGSRIETYLRWAEVLGLNRTEVLKLAGFDLNRMLPDGFYAVDLYQFSEIEIQAVFDFIKQIHNSKLSNSRTLSKLKIQRI
jgi:transcriptional regulator with XRE-family HTH domain